MTDEQKVQEARYRFVVDAVLSTNGEDPDYLGMRMNSAFGSAIGNGALTGESAAEVVSQEVCTSLLSTEAAMLDEDAATKWISLQLESGAMLLEDVAKLMARYALMDPADAREELAERMKLSNEDAAPDVAAVSAPRGG